MKFRLTTSSTLFRLRALAARARCSDPLVQTWGLIGSLLVIIITVHYVRGAGAGEQKNRSSAAELLEATGHDATEGWHPRVVFAPDTPASGLRANVIAELELRAIAARAAAREKWRYLPESLRETVAGLPTRIERIDVTWSGTSGGDASALELYHSTTRGTSGGTPCDFIIGNGRRGGDGRIEATRRWTKATSPDHSAVTICLIGTSETASITPAQEAALGELIASLEARSGHVDLSMRHPKHPDLLAHAD